jgi:6-pyruvoyltetrahydropterin/6-carboxytetrahydropterin synthase
MFEVGVVAHFSARHQLVGDFGPSSEQHGHRYRVVATVCGEALRPDGTLFDITVLQDALRAALDRLEGRDLNTLQQLARPNPTAEVVARYIFEQTAPAVASFELRVELWESDEAYASYSATSRR